MAGRGCDRTRAVYREVKRVLPPGWRLHEPERGGEMDGVYHAVAYYEKPGTFRDLWHKLGEAYLVDSCMGPPEPSTQGFSTVEAAIAYYELTQQTS